MIKKTSQVIIVLIFVLGISLVSAYSPTKKVPKSTSVKIMEPSYVADFSNDKILMGASHNVFVGKVLAQVGTKERGVGPETQFNVKVIENIKGNLKNTVVVDQQGGYKNGVLYVVGGGDTLTKSKANSYLLKPGSTYLFATRYNEKENWYTLNSFPTANKILSTDNSLDDLKLKTLAGNDKRVQALKIAYPNEILLDADVKNNNILNNYKSIQKQNKIMDNSNIDNNKTVKFSDTNGWVTVTPLRSAEGTATYWCVDSTGKSEGITTIQKTVITGPTTLCP